ncbi:MAG: pyridoxine 5'-phosphate synthase [Phycisphaerales bacterium]|nr:pyridoxine 5'-phosphate synthase [Phycisphaerales bacterium]
MPRLCVNIDHVATIRQARRTHEPDPVEAAIEAEAGGADGITVHLREDRRHIQDADLPRLKSVVQTRLNLEMAATEEMVQIAIALKPHLAMFVPEKRLEVTTEGGLDVASQVDRIRDRVRALMDAGIPVSAFIDADERQIDAAAQAGFSYCEIHTGPYAHAAHAGAASAAANAELAKVVHAVAHAQRCGMRANAGHALHYENVRPIALIQDIQELHIGHAIVSRAVFVGLREAVAAMKRAMATNRSAGC